MTQSLRVNEKEYLASTELSKKFNYTSDYISKLARDEKVLGTRVGRQWFVEVESLRTYLQQLEVEKKLQQESLSRQRKLELQTVPALSEEVVAEKLKQSNFSAAGQSLAVVSCGLLLGVLSLSAYSSGLKISDLSSGAKLVGEKISSQIFFGGRQLVDNVEPTQPKVATPLLSQSTVVSVTEELAGPQFETAGVYTVFPTLAATSTSYVAGAITYSTKPLLPQLTFSDEVVVTEIEGDVYVKPVLKDAVGEPIPVSALKVPPDNPR